jgi:hypothetical protein
VQKTEQMDKQKDGRKKNKKKFRNFNSQGGAAAVA